MAPWCVMGNFNEIVSQDEKQGGQLRPTKQMEDFKHALETNCLFDLGWQGTKYTWTNGHTNDTFTGLRLDRAVVSKEWIDKFRHQKVEVLAYAIFEPILISLQMEQFF